MLKRTMSLLGLTITVGALLLMLGCGGSNNNPVAPELSSDQPSRLWGDAQVSLSVGSPAIVTVREPVDGIMSITVRDSNGGRWYYFPKGATEFQFTLVTFGKAAYHVIGVVDMGSRADSTWIIYKDGRVVRFR